MSGPDDLSSGSLNRLAKLVYNLLKAPVLGPLLALADILPIMKTNVAQDSQGVYKHVDLC